MQGFSIQAPQGLRSPIVVVAFTGWSDTGTVTTDAAKRMVDAYEAQRFLEVDPEEYYVFTDTRPQVKLDDSGERTITWPTNEAFFARVPVHEHDLVMVIGVEPNLRWRTFSEQMADAIAATSPSLVCTLVARPAATPHTRPIPVSGSSADLQLAAKFGLGRSQYQGPTGVVGVLHDSLRRRGVPLISLAASVPHYLNVEENPPATLALLKALEPMTGLAAPVGDLDEEVVKFMTRVEEASRGDDQIAGYVRTLEQNYGEPDEPTPTSDGELPSVDDVLRDVEDLLRGNDP